MLPYAAIDPLALIFSGRTYLILVEKLHPHEPALGTLKDTVAHLSADERATTVANAKRLVAYGQAVLAVAEAR